MDISIRNITFKLYRADSTVQEFTKPIAGDNEMVQWTAEQYADVNQCGCTAHHNDVQIALAGNVQ